MNAGERIAEAIREGVRRHFVELDGERASHVYALVMAAAEKPLVETILEHTNGNQFHAAALLGINRNTLRKLIRRHGIRIKPWEGTTPCATPTRPHFATR